MSVMQRKVALAAF